MGIILAVHLELQGDGVALQWLVVGDGAIGLGIDIRHGQGCVCLHLYADSLEMTAETFESGTLARLHVTDAETNGGLVMSAIGFEGVLIAGFTDLPSGKGMECECATCDDLTLVWVEKCDSILLYFPV